MLPAVFPHHIPPLPFSANGAGLRGSCLAAQCLRARIFLNLPTDATKVKDFKDSTAPRNTSVYPLEESMVDFLSRAAPNRPSFRLTRILNMRRLVE